VAQVNEHQDDGDFHLMMGRTRGPGVIRNRLCRGGGGHNPLYENLMKKANGGIWDGGHASFAFVMTSLEHIGVLCK
jgi:hypothetical protein